MASYPSSPMVVSPTVSSAALWAALVFLPGPECAMSYLSTLRIVWSMPARPASPMWLLASETQSMPAVLRPLM